MILLSGWYSRQQFRGVDRHSEAIKVSERKFDVILLRDQLNVVYQSIQSHPQQPYTDDHRILHFIELQQVW